MIYAQSVRRARRTRYTTCLIIELIEDDTHDVPFCRIKGDKGNKVHIPHLTQLSQST